MITPNPTDNINDPKNFRMLYKRYYPGLVVFAREFMITTAEAEDIVQDIFITLWEKKNKLVINSIKTYLFRATQNSCLNFLSHLKVRTKHQNTILKEQKAIDALNEDFYVEADLEKLLLAAIDSLPPQRQKIFIMSRMEGKTIAKISEELEISPRTVEKHLQLSLASLRKHMAEYIPLGLIAFLIG